MEQPQAPPRNARAEFRARLAAFAEEHSGLSAGEAAEQFGGSLPDQDRELVNEFLTTEARNILAWELRAQFSRNRAGIFAALDITNPDRPAVAELGERAQESLYERITQWREFVPSDNRAQLLMVLTRPKLRESAQYDAGHVAHFGWKMLLKTRLADGMPDDMTPVGSHYTPEQIAALGEQIRRDMTRGNFRLKIQPVRPLPGPTAVPRQGDGRHAEGPEADRGLAAS